VPGGPDAPGRPAEPDDASPPHVHDHDLDLRPLRLCRAEEIMSRRVVSIDGGATVAEAIRKMRAEHVSCLIIERRDVHDAWGLVTRADVIHRVVTPGRDPVDVRVYEIMTKPIITVSPGLLLKFCLRLMEQAHVRRVVVFDGHKLVGVLSHNDILAALRV
jgi:CBS domain-containing protein